jgi:acetyl esterase/lipase
MADVWFKALQKILPASEESYEPEIVSYKNTEQGNLDLHFFVPKECDKNEKHPAVVFFFGGGWSLGTPLQFYRECVYYASKGFVAVSADYRINYLNQTSPFESVEDAKDALRWIRKNADKWDIDPNRIVAAGSSAGGHLAAATGTLGENGNETDYKPNLMLLYYPVVDNGPDGYGSESMKKRYREISPLHNIDSKTPPALFILGTKDPLIPVKTAKAFQTQMEENGVDCELHLMEGAGHPIFYYAKDLTPEFYTIRKITDDFLRKYGYLK